RPPPRVSRDSPEICRGASVSIGQSVLALGITLMAPVLWAALGEIVLEQSGVINIGIEGVMLIAAFGAGVTQYYLQSLTLGLVFAVVAGGLCGLLLALLYVRLGTDQVVTGILFNVFAL